LCSYCIVFAVLCTSVYAIALNYVVTFVCSVCSQNVSTALQLHSELFRRSDVKELLEHICCISFLKHVFDAVI